MPQESTLFEGRIPETLSSWMRSHIQELEDRTFLFGALKRENALRRFARFTSMGYPECAQIIAYVAINSPFKALQRQAETHLIDIQKQKAIDHIWEVWEVTRHPKLENLLKIKAVPASASPQKRVTSCLIIYKPEDLQKKIKTPGDLPYLANCCLDRSEQIAKKAGALINAVESKAGLEALVSIFIKTGNPLVLEKLQAAQYTSEHLNKQVMFAFLTGDLAAYDALDFDRRILAAAYNLASPALRQEIMHIIQRHGRTDLLPVITGLHQTSRLDDVTEAESDTLITMLVDARNWQRLWELVTLFTPKWSIIAFKHLLDQGFTPPNPDDQQLWKICQDLYPHLPDPDALDNIGVFPPAFEAAKINVPGRINDLGFSPNDPHIAIGTGVGKVAIWDFEKGEMVQKLTDFEHSVGNLAYTHSGILVCAERANPDMPCNIKTFRDGQLETLGSHQYSIKALTPVGQDRILSTSKDLEIRYWDVHNHALINARKIYPYPRAIKPWPEGNQALLISKTLHILELPQMTEIQMSRRQRAYPVNRSYLSGTGTCAVFLPEEDAFILGKTTGQVWRYKREKKTFYCDQAPITEHQNTVRGVDLVENQSTLISGGGEGVLHFVSLPDKKILEKIHLQAKNLTSFQISQNGYFMVTGNADAEMSLWDLRPLKLLDLSQYHFASSQPDLIGGIQGLQEIDSLSNEAKALLSYIEHILRFRHRNDIEIAPSPRVRRGEFDILLDEENQT